MLGDEFTIINSKTSFARLPRKPFWGGGRDLLLFH